MAVAQSTKTTVSDFRIIKDQRLIRSTAFVNSQWVDSGLEKPLEIINPATLSLLGTMASLSTKAAAGAVDYAHAAFPSWSQRLPQERAAILRRWYELMLENKEDLALIMTLEQGKPISEARGEIDYAASFIEYYAEEAKRPNIEGVTSHLRDAEVEVWREPMGVAALITPWNFPAAMITRKAAAALAAGCTVVAHPSKETPFSATALAELAHRAGMLAGVYNVVTGEAPVIVGAWLKDPRVRVMSFTGSTEVGQLLYRESATTVKRLILELGGHAPFLVFADADMDQAIDCTVSAKFATSGQDCLGANRFYVERSVYDDFCKRFTERAAALTVGPGMGDPDIGPLMNEGAINKQTQHVNDAIAKGARLLCGGGKHEAGPLFFESTVLTDVSEDALIMREEMFGPVAAITPFDTEDDVIGQANNTEYGLVAYLHTQNHKRIYRASRALEFGMVAVNRTKVTGAPIPFGGMKQSGIGREGARLGMEAFTDVKYVCRNWA